MYGDFSRGHEPDRARGRHYRRVLLQQGRPVLDSDEAARVDALLAEIRATTRALGCRAGSSDHGFLVTPGRLVTVFSEVRDALRVVSGTPDAWLDYRFRYAGRYPALHLAAPAGAARIEVPALQDFGPTPADTRLTLWAHVESSTTLGVNGVDVPLNPAAGTGPAPYTFEVEGATFGPVQLRLDSGEVWLFLLEEFRPAGDLGTFGVAGGTYQVDGLVADTEAATFPDQAFPSGVGFGWGSSPPLVPLPGLTAPPAAGDRVVAYLEVWEQAISSVEDPGIQEVALGSTDTSIRTELVSQVKLATVDGSVTGPDAARAAFDRVAESGGEVDLSVPVGSTTPDPCALPEAEGYSGDDNRLYRIQVHRGGPLEELRLTWSRDNASELFGADLSVSNELVLDAGTALAAGDLVEVLSTVVDLGDEARAVVDDGSFVPAQRAVGQLGQLVEIPSQAGDDTVRFRLADVNDASVQVELDDRYATTDPAAAGLKLRRWHGVLDPQRLAGTGTPGGGPYVLEDGITVTLSTDRSYRPGQYWQYAARTGSSPAATWRRAPHGPARWFAPLALLRLPDSSSPDDTPWELVAWLDERFSHLCDLDADDIAFDGDRVPTESDTVQEALEELYSRIPTTPVWPTVARRGISWQNDRTLPMSEFTEGLRVTFSEEMNPATASASSFVVTLEVPLAENPLLRTPFVVDGSVSTAGREWTFVPRGVEPRQVADWVERLGSGVRCRVRLAADVILDQAGERPLDGEATGRLRTDGYDTFVDLVLPSGNGERGGDFHSWFFLEGPPPLVRVESVTPRPDTRVAPDSAPGVVMVSFSHPVRFDTLTPDTLQVLARTETQRGVGKPVSGTIQPYPFETNPRLVSRVTFVPDDPADLQPTTLKSGQERARVVTVKVVGDAERPVLDSEGRPIDGAGSGTASDFTAAFTVGNETS